MKLHTIPISIVLAAIAGAAMAGNPGQSTQPVTQAPVIAECPQPHLAQGIPCNDLDELVRANFTPREINTVLAWKASHPQFLFDEIYELHERYEAVLQEYMAAQKAAGTARIADQSPPGDSLAAE